MKRILITGGDGTLGKQIVASLSQKEVLIRIMSRKHKPQNLASNIEWASADVVAGEGVAAALADVDTIVNCLSSPMANTYETDIVGTKNFLAQAKQAGVNKLIHISILGIDRIMFPYYQYKLGAELVVAEAGIPYTIARISQFHSFVDYLLSPLQEVETDEVTIPVDVKFQPISTKDVAAYLAPHILDESTNEPRLAFGGPEILTLQELATDWLKAKGINRSIKPATEAKTDLPFLSYFGDGFVNGYNTNTENRVGNISWQDYLAQTYAAREPMLMN